MSEYLVLLFPLAWLFTGVATFFLTRTASPRPWLWAFAALVVYFVAWRVVCALFYGELPPPWVLGHAFEEGTISLRAYEEGRDEYNRSRQIASVVAVFPGLLVGIVRRLTALPLQPAEVKRTRRRKKRRSHEVIAGEREPRSRTVRDAGEGQSVEPNVYAHPRTKRWTRSGSRIARIEKQVRNWREVRSRRPSQPGLSRHGLVLARARAMANSNPGPRWRVGAKLGYALRVSRSATLRFFGCWSVLFACACTAKPIDPSVASGSSSLLAVDTEGLTWYDGKSGGMVHAPFEARAPSRPLRNEVAGMTVIPPSSFRLDGAAKRE